MVDIRQFLSDASHATHGQGLDKEPVCYMGQNAYYGVLNSIQPSSPASLQARDKRINGVQVFIVREDDDHYHMTFRRK